MDHIHRVTIRVPRRTQLGPIQDRLTSAVAEFLELSPSRLRVEVYRTPVLWWTHVLYNVT